MTLRHGLRGAHLLHHPRHCASIYGLVRPSPSLSRPVQPELSPAVRPSLEASNKHGSLRENRCLSCVSIFVVRFILGGRRTTHFVVQFIFWRMTKSVCRAFYFLAHGKLSFSLPLPRRQTSLAFVVRQAKAHDRDILFTMCFPPAHDKHILLSCVFLKHTTKYF